jgi:hypothetical protein
VPIEWAVLSGGRLVQGLLGGSSLLLLIILAAFSDDAQLIVHVMHYAAALRYFYYVLGYLAWLVSVNSLLDYYSVARSKQALAQQLAASTANTRMAAEKLNAFKRFTLNNFKYTMGSVIVYSVLVATVYTTMAWDNKLRMQSQLSYTSNPVLACSGSSVTVPDSIIRPELFAVRANDGLLALFRSWKGIVILRCAMSLLGWLFASMSSRTVQDVDAVVEAAELNRPAEEVSIEQALASVNAGDRANLDTKSNQELAKLAADLSSLVRRIEVISAARAANSTSVAAAAQVVNVNPIALPQTAGDASHGVQV